MTDTQPFDVIRCVVSTGLSPFPEGWTPSPESIFHIDVRACTTLKLQVLRASSALDPLGHTNFGPAIASVCPFPALRCVRLDRSRHHSFACLPGSGAAESASRRSTYNGSKMSASAAISVRRSAKSSASSRRLSKILLKHLGVGNLARRGYFLSSIFRRLSYARTSPTRSGCS